MNREKIRNILLWPSTKRNNKNPWFLILWRLSWAPAIYAGIILTTASVLFAFGYRDAVDFWNDVI